MEQASNGSQERLYRIIAAVESVEECRALLLDLCTVRELEEMGQRLSAAFLLSEGKNYQDISGATGLSTATISRVSKALKSGSGYKRAIERETDGGRTEA